MVSIIMSVYNERPSWLREAVESIRNQTLRDFEFIIVIDNPDISAEIRAYLEETRAADSRIRLLPNEKNIGLAMSLNHGIAAASGEYIARMDADDICDSDLFAREMNLLLEQSYDMVFSNKVNIDEDGHVLYADPPITKDPNRALPFGNMVVHPSVLMRTDVMKALNGYRNFPNSEDYDLWLRLVDAGYCIGVMNECLLKCRLRTNGARIGRGLEQFYTAKYIVQLHKERKKCSRDSYSEINLSAYLKRARLTDKRNAAYQKAAAHMEKAVQHKNSRRYAACFAEVVKSFFQFPELTLEVMKNVSLSKFSQLLEGTHG